MKILITGNNGFIGSRVLSYLQEKEYNVVGANADIRDGLALMPYFKNVDFVVHTAGETKDFRNKKLCYDVNVLGTRNVVELCLENNCKLIHLSSTQRYTPYGRSKQESQKMVEEYIDKGLQVVILRLCPIITEDNKLVSVKGRYYLENLVVDIENIILNYDFKKYKLIDYGKQR